MISAELNRRLDGFDALATDERPLAPTGSSLRITFALMWLQFGLCLVQLFVLPWIQGRSLSTYALGPAIGIASAYGLFALHFMNGHAKARLPYAVFNGLLLTLSFASLSDPDRGAATVLTCLSIVLSGGVLYGALGHSMDAWLQACKERVTRPLTDPAHLQRAEAPALLRAFAKRARAAARSQALVGLAWLSCGVLGTAALVRASEPDLLVPATVGLGPLLLAGIVVLASGLLKLRRAKENGAAAK